MNAVVIAVIIMLVLSLSRVHVVTQLGCRRVCRRLGGRYAFGECNQRGWHVVQQGIIPVFNEGLKGGAQIALSYAMLGAFAMAITHSGLPQQLAGVIIRNSTAAKAMRKAKARSNGCCWRLFCAWA